MNWEIRVKMGNTAEHIIQLRLPPLHLKFTTRSECEIISRLGAIHQLGKGDLE